MFARLIVTVAIVLAPLAFSLAQNSFVGVKTCGMCHKSEKAGNQLGIWENSKHSKAYEVLLTDEANKIASEKGFTTKAAETPECLKCHTSGSDVDASLLGTKFNIEQGVQCETCHGAGSEYKSKKVMEDKELAVKNGLMLYENTEDLCITCHNAESPTATEFNFAESWEKIKHSKPE
jgi:excinuclease UvrABC ATPase subunit